MNTYRIDMVWYELAANKRPHVDQIYVVAENAAAACTQALKERAVYANGHVKSCYEA